MSTPRSRTNLAMRRPVCFRYNFYFGLQRSFAAIARTGRCNIVVFSSSEKNYQYYSPLIVHGTLICMSVLRKKVFEAFISVVVIKL